MGSPTRGARRGSLVLVLLGLGSCMDFRDREPLAIGAGGLASSAGTHAAGAGAVGIADPSGGAGLDSGRGGTSGDADQRHADAGARVGGAGTHSAGSHPGGGGGAGEGGAAAAAAAGEGAAQAGSAGGLEGDGAAGAGTASFLEAEWSGVLDSFGLAGTDIATASRSVGTLDLFAVSADGGVNLYSFGSIWPPAQVLGAPEGVTLTAVAALNITPYLDVIATGSDHELYFNEAKLLGDETPLFAGWSTIEGALTNGEPNSLALVTMGDGSFHAFWITETGTIGHAWGAAGATEPQLETGDDPFAFYLRPAVRPTSLNAISPLPARIDIVLDGSGETSLQHLWYDAVAGYWGAPATPHLEQLHCVKAESDAARFVDALSGFALLASGDGSFDVFVSEHRATAPTSVYRSSFSVNTGWAGDGAQIWFERFGVSIDAPSTVVDGIVWSNEQRKDVFGVVTDSTLIWQAYYH
jgi:hypothetical protein